MKEGEIGTKNYRIKRAEEEDLAKISDIAQGIKINPWDVKKEDCRDGFLVYSLDEEDYQKRLNDFFLTFKQNDKIIGFLMCYDRNFLEKLIQENEISHEDGITDFLTNLPSDADFVFGDQIGVLAENRKSNIGKRMMEELFKEMTQKKISNMYVAILQEPICNEVSINFVSGFGFKKIKDIRNTDNSVWGIYHLELKKTKN